MSLKKSISAMAVFMLLHHPYFSSDAAAQLQCRTNRVDSHPLTTSTTGEFTRGKVLFVKGDVFTVQEGPYLQPVTRHQYLLVSEHLVVGENGFLALQMPDQSVRKFQPGTSTELHSGLPAGSAAPARCGELQLVVTIPHVLAAVRG